MRVSALELLAWCHRHGYDYEVANYEDRSFPGRALQSG
jgi:hypothetical protein